MSDYAPIFVPGIDQLHRDLRRCHRRKANEDDLLAEGL